MKKLSLRLLSLEGETKIDELRCILKQLQEAGITIIAPEWEFDPLASIEEGEHEASTSGEREKGKEIEDYVLGESSDHKRRRLAKE